MIQPHRPMVLSILSENLGVSVISSRSREIRKLLVPSLADLLAELETDCQIPAISLGEFGGYLVGNCGFQSTGSDILEPFTDRFHGC